MLNLDKIARRAAMLTGYAGMYFISRKLYISYEVNKAKAAIFENIEKAQATEFNYNLRFLEKFGEDPMALRNNKEQDPLASLASQCLDDLNKDNAKKIICAAEAGKYKEALKTAISRDLLTYHMSCAGSAEHYTVRRRAFRSMLDDLYDRKRITVASTDITLNEALSITNAIPAPYDGGSLNSPEWKRNLELLAEGNDAKIAKEFTTAYLRNKPCI